MVGEPTVFTFDLEYDPLDYYETELEYDPREWVETELEFDWSARTYVEVHAPGSTAGDSLHAYHPGDIFSGENLGTARRLPLRSEC